MTRTLSLKWLSGVALAVALTSGTLPAVAAEQPDAVQQPAPVETPATSPAPTANPAESTAPAPQPTEAPAPAAPSAPAESVPEATPPAEPESGAVEEDWLAELIGPLGAKMGQGLERLEETGNAQVPTAEETALEAKVERLAEDGVLPDAAATETPQAAPAASISLAANIQLAADWRPPGIQGMDVSSHQLDVDWRHAWNQGSRFAYVKATEATSYKNPYYNQQYNGSVDVGMYRGAYHFAIPGVSSGAEQANYFVNNGGGWSADGRTLPPLLDIEYNPYAELGNTCYNLSAAQMVSWIRDFSNTVKARTGRLPMIYSTTDWWNRCTGSSTAFADHPLHIANYNQVGAGTLPAGWSSYNVWQYSSSGPFAGDSNVFNGSSTQLHEFSRRADSYNVDTRRPIGAAWQAASGVDGSWGLPTANESCYPTYCVQTFDRTTAYLLTSTGEVRTVYTAGAIGNAWKAAGTIYGASSWGLPTGAEVCYGSVYCTQSYERAVAYFRPSSGVSAVLLNTEIGRAWTAAGTIYGSASWGIPSSNHLCEPTYCTQSFERTAAYRGNDGAVRTIYLPGAIGSAWKAAGTIYGAASWGMPTSGETCTGGVCTQTFERDTAFWTQASGVHTVRTSSLIGGAWTGAGKTSGWGRPTGNQACYPSYCTQEFESRSVYSMPATGVTSVALNESVGKAWKASGGLGGAASWGIPLTNQACYPTYCTQVFERHTAYWPKNGAVTTVQTTGHIGKAWTASGTIFGSSSWGLPQSPETCEPTYCTQVFERTVAYWTAAKGVKTVVLADPIGKAWTASGRIHGTWGMPTENQVCYPTYCTQNFERTTAYWTQANGVSSIYLPGQIGTAWTASGGIHGAWGMSTGNQTCSGSTSCTQNFERTTVTWTSSGGVRVTPRRA
ncbi:GH25 family lysozyme [Arthrobacter sp. zg-Y895]|uniref:GH25 family lysozyme n=1 Tax=Arthrobacter sp. zg-Y895 TaxID=2886933 RepID=UPI001D15103C|nr:GH25 family lysozyme [Arthrobacter sp. zg-Y895]MCC3299999.1 hypothetical protein [Arthrobacter sp. zg-Y895]